MRAVMRKGPILAHGRIRDRESSVVAGATNHRLLGRDRSSGGTRRTDKETQEKQTSPRTAQRSLFEGRPTGLEPATAEITIRRSTN